MDFTGKVVAITGSGRGIGYKIAKMYSEANAKVLINDISEENALEAVKLITKNGGEAIAFTGDVSQPEMAEGMIAMAVETYGKIDILINNAGTLSDKLIGKMNIEDWEHVLNACLRSTFLCTKYAADHMIEQQSGKIVNISSRAYLGNPGQGNYSAAKAGVIGFTKAMAKELGRHSINVNAVAPGLILTDALSNHPKFKMIKERAEKETPLRRIGETEEVANAVLFLSSDLSSYITGDVIHVTGGRFS